MTVAKLDDFSDRGRSYYVEALGKSAWPVRGGGSGVYETERQVYVYFREKGDGLERAAKQLAAIASFIASSSGKAREGGPLCAFVHRFRCQALDGSLIGTVRLDHSHISSIAVYGCGTELHIIALLEKKNNKNATK